MEIKTVPIESIFVDPANARKHPQKNMDAIKGSISKFQQVEPLVVQKSKKIIIGGNGRYQAMKELGFKEVQIVEVDLTDTQAAALAISLNRTGELAEWDMDVLPDLLLSLQEEDFDLASIGFDEDDLGLFLDKEDLEKENKESIYTNKIEIPIYEPKGKKPNIKDLINQEKMSSLISEINNSSLSPEEKEFLRLSAFRHNIFDYENIAEFYCHSSQEMKDLMEKSALVIIDVNKAIENGFVSLTKEIAEIYKNEPDINE